MDYSHSGIEASEAKPGQFTCLVNLISGLDEVIDRLEVRLSPISKPQGPETEREGAPPVVSSDINEQNHRLNRALTRLQGLLERIDL